jgi:exosortase/archaeosortase family protein
MTTLFAASFADTLGQSVRAALRWPARPAGAPALACRPCHVSPLGWVALQALALWPHGAWIVRRAADGSDDPLGLAALAVLALFVAWHASRLRLAPHTGWLAAAGALTLAANAALFVAPPLAAALLAALALAAGLVAWWPAAAPRVPLLGLLVLAAPLIASLQYYGGYPLRVLTAQLSAALLQLAGIVAEPAGASMLVRGQLVVVDAPCSGVQMVWMAYFSACTVAAWTALRDADFVRRLPLVGLVVLMGNVVRNAVLVALEARPQGLDATLHQAIGLAALALVCAAVVAIVSKRGAA